MKFLQAFPSKTSPEPSLWVLYVVTESNVVLLATGSYLIKIYIN